MTTPIDPTRTDPTDPLPPEKFSSWQAALEKGLSGNAPITPETATAADETLEEVIVKLLAARKETLATAESCTGCLLANRITNVPGASEVFIGDGPAMDRDTEAILESVKLKEYVGPLGGFFRDLNLDDVERVPLATRASRLKELYLPKTVLGVDFLVSVAKLKTHHWAGVTLSLKNMFGIVPGACYGWPKNVLHWAGIDRSILDINAVARPDFAIIDGIIGMEGNGPLQGTPKPAGVLIFGDDPVAVDATGCRVMGLNPDKVSYLAGAGTLLGHVDPLKIQQVGETIERVRAPFAVLDEFLQLIG